MEDKVRVFEIAEEAGATSTEVIKKASDLSIILKSPQSTVSFEQAELITEYIMTGESNLLSKVKETTKKKKEVIKTTAEEKTVNKPKNSNKTEIKEVKKTSQVVPKKEVLLKRKELKIIQKKNPPKKEEIKEADRVKSVEVKEIKTANKIEPIETEKIKQTTEINTPKNSTTLKQKETTSKDNSDKIVLKKRGLTIVKKKRPQLSNVPATPQSKKQKMASMSELFGASADLQEEYTPRAKKAKHKQAAKAHDHGRKLKVSTDNSDFKESEDSIMGEEVVLLDMGLMETSKFLQDTPKPKNIRTTKPSAFGNQPRGLKRGKKKKKYKAKIEEIEITEVTIPEDCRVYEFAEKIGKTAGDVIGKLFMLGMMVTKNDFLESDEIEILGEEYGIEITVKDMLEDVNYVGDYHEEEDVDETNFISRPPVVTIMGHVDHGKTSLLDKIRSSRVAASEAGGITQHIGAYTVNKNGHDITFVDTPGHEAFSAMRIRGASVTDIIIIVVAADDGVKPQTIESIKAAKESGAPIIVAVNKMDKETANIDMVKAGMAEQDMTPADWGGDIEFIGVSAHTGDGIDDLLENILIQSELLELKADPTALAKSTVIESMQVKGRGAVATVIIQNGTLRVGDNIVADTTFGRVKALLDDNGKAVKELCLSRTGQVVGLNDVPPTGSHIVALQTAAEAKEIATTRAAHARAKELSHSTKVSLDEMAALIAEGKIKALPVILKADAGGSLEAIKSSLEAIKNDEVKVKIISSGVGGITEADIALATASDDCIILGFNVRPTGAVKTKAKSENVEIKTYSIIYALLDDIKATLSGMMSSIVVEENTGQAQVLETFVVPKIGTVAGTKVTDGKVIRGGLARIIREGVVVYTGAIKSLKRFKDDVKEVSNGYECGIIFENYNDIRVHDYIETFIEHKEEQTID